MSNLCFLYFYLQLYITFSVDARNITCYQEGVVRKGNMEDANDTTRDDKISQEKWIQDSRSKWFTCKNEK